MVYRSVHVKTENEKSRSNVVGKEQQAETLEMKGRDDCDNPYPSGLHIFAQPTSPASLDQVTLPQLRRRDADSLQQAIYHEVRRRAVPNAREEEGDEVAEESQGVGPLWPAFGNSLVQRQKK